MGFLILKKFRTWHKGSGTTRSKARNKRTTKPLSKTTAVWSLKDTFKPPVEVMAAPLSRWILVWWASLQQAEPLRWENRALPKLIIRQSKQIILFTNLRRTYRNRLRRLRNVAQRSIKNRTEWRDTVDFGRTVSRTWPVRLEKDSTQRCKSNQIKRARKD